MSKQKKCIVPTCPYTNRNSPDQLFVPLIDSLKELWCQKLKLELDTNTIYYCCEKHLNAEDLENDKLCKTVKEEPIMEPTAELLNIPSESDVDADPLITVDVPPDPSEHEASELFRLLLSEDTTPIKSVKFDYSQTLPPYKVSVGVQCKARTRDACVGFIGRKNLSIGFKDTSSAPMYTEVESTDVTKPCCCCMLRSSNSDVRTPYTCDDRTETYMDLFEECFGIELELEYDDECGICDECVCRLQDARDFKLQVQRSQQELRERRRRLRDKDGITEDDSDLSDNCMDENQLLPSATTVKLEVLEETCKDEKVFIACSEIQIEICKQEPSDTTEQPSISSERRDHDMTHECHTCHRTFRSVAGLKTHMRVHTKHVTQVKKHYSSDDENSDDGHACDECGKQFKSKLRFTKHMQTHESYNPHTCDICSKVFSHEGYLSLHKKGHASEPYTCDYCNKKFTTKKRLISHISVHMHGKRYSCELCNKKFKSKYSLKGHNLLHIKEKRYSCKTCKKQFSHVRLLKRHNVIHNKGPLVCETCGRQFTCLSTYTVHRRVHTGEKPYECSICKKRFASKGNMMLHERTHSGERPYFCDSCPKRFTNSSGLKHHQTVHTKEKSFSCDICGKSFSQYYSMKLHKLVHTGEKPHCCHVCGKKFGRKEHLNRHFDTHKERKSYTCEYCSKIYTNKHGFAQHVRSHIKSK